MKQCVKCERHLPPEKFYNTSKTCKECVLKAQRERRSADFAGQKRIHQSSYLKANYGMTLEEFEQRLEEQGGVCAICKQPETGCSRQGRVKRLSVDHDHKTGKIRGLICNGCNRALGYFNDDPEKMRAAIDYLEKNCA